MNLAAKIANKLIDYGFPRISNYNGKRVVMYHGVDLHGSTKFNLRFIDVKSFEAQIRFFKKKFNVISLEEFFLKKPSAKKFDIAITFDDGYKNNFDHALPILEKHKIPATFFITGMNKNIHPIIWADLYEIGKSFESKDFEFNNTLFKRDKTSGKYYNEQLSFPDFFKQDKRQMPEKIDELVNCIIVKNDDFRQKKEYFDYWKLMTDEDIRATSVSSHIKIGSHGFYHNNLGIQDLNTSVKELELSKSYLEKLTSYKITSLAYPDGSYSRELITEASKLGFKEQCAVNYLHTEDQQDDRIIDRFGIYRLGQNKNRVAHSIVNSI